MIALAYLMSLLAGGLLFRLLARKENVDLALAFCLSAGLGLGITSYAVFFSYVLFDGLRTPFIIGFHAALLMVLIVLNRPLPRILPSGLARLKNPGVWLGIIVLGMLCVPLWLQANFYPYGGWDAWSCWNFKAKFLFSGGEEWKNIFDPALWRASPHYPLLLPLVNVWGWIFAKTATHWVPLTNAVVFTLLTAGLLFSALKVRVHTLSAAAGALLVFSLPFFTKLAVSQYSDIVLSYYLLAGLVCFLNGYADDRQPFVFLSGLFWGFLTFTKPEGMIAGALAALIGASYLFLTKQKPLPVRKRLLAFLSAGFLAGIVPTVLFQVLYSPGNQTFINGFTSASHPLTVGRIKLTALFFLIEPLSDKWNGVWVILAGGLLLSGRKCLRGELLIFPAFLFAYLGAVFAYYLTNTYFEIGWWLSVTFNRILFSLLPMTVFWAVYSLGKTSAAAGK